MFYFVFSPLGPHCDAFLKGSSPGLYSALAGTKDSQ